MTRRGSKSTLRREPGRDLLWKGIPDSKPERCHPRSHPISLFLFVRFLADTGSIFGPLVPLFWISGNASSGFQSGLCLIHIAEANVMYIPKDPPLLLHVPSSWLPAPELVTFRHALAEVGLGSDSNQ